MVPEGATTLSKLYIVWADGFEYKAGDATFKLSVRNVEISGPEGSIMLQADYRLSLPTTGKTILLMDLTFSGNSKPAFDIYVDNSGNLIVKPTLKYVLHGEIQNSWDVAKYEYQKTHRISGSNEVVDDVLVIYRKDGNPKVIGLTKPVPPKVDSAHGVAVFHAEDYVMEKIGGKISFEEEVPTDLLPRIVDMKVEKDGSISIWEVKTGMEIRIDTGQVDKDAWIVKKKGYVVYYYFDQPPSERGAREYLSYIREKYTGDSELRGKMFIVIGRGDPVEPTDSSLDAYISGG